MGHCQYSMLHETLLVTTQGELRFRPTFHLSPGQAAGARFADLLGIDTKLSRRRQLVRTNSAASWPTYCHCSSSAPAAASAGGASAIYGLPPVPICTCCLYALAARGAHPVTARRRHDDGDLCHPLISPAPRDLCHVWSLAASVLALRLNAVCELSKGSRRFQYRLSKKI